ncbi:unnamed protein product, partial [marine sediment metagenome]
GERAIPILFEALKDQENWMIPPGSGSIIEALAGIGEPAIPLLLEGLKDKDDNARAAAAIVLGEIGDIRAVGPLTEALNDDNETVRFFVEEALGEIRKAQEKDEEKTPGKVPHIDLNMELFPGLRIETFTSQQGWGQTRTSPAKTPDHIGRFKLGSPSRGTVIAWDPNTGDTVNLSQNEKGDLWDPNTGEAATSESLEKLFTSTSPVTEGKIIILRGHEGAVNSVTFSNGVVVSIGDDGTTRSWDPKTGEPIVVFKDHDGPVKSITIIGDGEVV